ncbi:MAG: acetoin utilization protein AcuC [Rhodospirillales bacterium]|nr:MAG: acetoin utilization protein AcuC [Rhodospirillales bacterium]
MTFPKSGLSPLLIGSDIYRTSRHAPGHPLAIPRVALMTDLCRVLGWLPDGAYREAPMATTAELARFHAPDYVDAVMRAERCQALSPAEIQRFNLGINGNPVYPEMFRRPATACGASVLAARLLLGGLRVVYNPAGGTHHGQRARASGFCTFNDPVLAILALLDGGLERVFYLDLDAHFGDGVQAAFHHEPRVFTVSIHEAGRWPMRRDGPPTTAGGIQDRGGGNARNLPLPPPANDNEFAYLMEAAVLPLLAAAEPEAVVVQCGADALADDPMTRLALANGALWQAVAQVAAAAPRLLVLGGGGYNPFAVARCWAGVWGLLSGCDIAAPLSSEAETLMRTVRWNHRRARMAPEAWFTALADPPRPGPIRPEVRALTRTVLVR